MRKITDAKLLRLWAQAVVDRAGRKCEYPLCECHYTQVHPHHVYSRRNAITRYDISNGIALCPFHHTFGSWSAHKDPDFISIIIAAGVRTQKWHDELMRLKNTVAKNNDAFKKYWFDKLTQGQGFDRPVDFEELPF